MNWKKIVDKVPAWLMNKYLITCAVFAIILVCCGEQSLIERTRRMRRIHALEEELDNNNRNIERYRTDMEALQADPANIERFAREHYYMHADDEDVYLIEEE
ncbi:MAG: septum formation initiator family protein [Paludibacter sp.]|nr:septum formation initiator family protein [Bacteroidales bacterium]MCM1069309.1 septum formation initiator family protein [Prevotella sp.]MCM1353708.1 septum formation initiator family protein [Bacteroides sp.]MCM1442224.1 septum formation initiator family protein [Muribaculum sp.]MCM1482186.1 septum formation initiator family protein [Paludibacter sp.]